MNGNLPQTEQTPPPNPNKTHHHPPKKGEGGGKEEEIFVIWSPNLLRLLHSSCRMFVLTIQTKQMSKVIYH